MQDSVKQEIVVLSTDSEDDSIDVRMIWRTLKKWRWIIFMLPCISAILGLVISLQLPLEYQATARILIEKNDPHVLSFQKVFEGNPADQDYYQTQLKILQSRSLAENVIKTLHLEQHLEEEALQEPTAMLHRYVKEAQKFLGLQASASTLPENTSTTANGEKISAYFAQKVRVIPVANSRLVDVQVRSSEPDLVALIANTLVDAYMAQHLENKLAVSKEAGHWLEKELEEAQKKVLDSERTLQEYNQKHDIIAVEDRQDLGMQQLSELTSALNQARVERMAIEVTYWQIQKLKFEDAGIVPQITNDRVIQQLKLKLLNFETEKSELLKKFRSQHPNVIALQSQIDSTREQLHDAIQQIFQSINTEYAMAAAREQELQSLVDKQKLAMQELNQQMGAYSVLQREVESNRRIYEALLQRVKETDVTERLETSNIQVIERAREPRSPVGPRKSRNTLLALILGVVAGVGFAFIGEALNNKITTPEEFEDKLKLKFLGLIPKISSKDVRLRDCKPARENIIAMITSFLPKSAVSEAYRGLRTNVRFSLTERENILLVTSSEPSEGKSSLVSNLGITFAQNGQKTLIIDCDFRKPMMGQIFNLDKALPGFTDLIIGDLELDDAICSTNLSELDVMPCGSIPPNPSELLGSSQTSRIFQSLGMQYDVLLLDSPPITAVTDPLVLGQLATGALLVVRAGQTKLEVIQYSVTQLQNMGINLIGGVLNAVDLRKNASYCHYGYQNSQYYHRKSRKKTRRKG